MEDSIAVSDVKGGSNDDVALLRSLERRPSSVGSQLSFRLRQVSRRFAPSRPLAKLDRSKSGAARAINGLKFMTGRVDGWKEVERRFDELAIDGKLPKSHFGHCIGIYLLIRLRSLLTM